MFDCGCYFSKNGLLSVYSLHKSLDFMRSNLTAILFLSVVIYAFGGGFVSSDE
jgi:hypothetical protein